MHSPRDRVVPSSDCAAAVAVAVASFVAEASSDLCVEEVPPGVSLSVKNAKGLCEPFHFDKVVCSTSTLDTSDVLYETVAQRLVNGFAEGRHGCLIAYGCAGLGKSSCLFGISGDGSKGGIAQRMCRDILAAFVRMPAYVETSTTATIVEIYNEKVRDLLDTQALPPQLAYCERKVRFHPELGTYFEGVTRAPVAGEDDVAHLLRCAKSKSRSAAGSLSHVVLQLHLRYRDVERGIQRVSTLSIVDMAGSEVGNVGAHHGRNTQLSNRMLRRVVEIASDSKNKGKLPLKESCLTWLLSDALGGDALLSWLFVVSPLASNVDETLRTLRFAALAKLMRTSPKIHEEKCSVVVHAIQQEMAVIQQKLIATNRNQHHEDYTKLQKDLSFRAKELQDEQSRKTKAREELSEQVERTTKELEALQHKLHTKQLAAAKSQKMQEEISRLAQSRDLAMKRLAEEESLRKQTEQRIVEARHLEEDIKRMRAEREKLEAAARREQLSQSARVFRNIFTVATGVGKDRHFMKEIESRNKKLKSIVEDYTWRVENADDKIVEVRCHIQELTAQHDRVAVLIAELQSARGVFAEAEAAAARSTERANVDLVNAVSAIRVEAADVDSISTPAACAEEPQRVAHVNVSRDLRPEHMAMVEITEAIHVEEAACEALERQLLRHEEADVRLGGWLAEKARQSQLLEEQLLECNHEVEVLHKEIQFLSSVSTVCEQNRDDTEMTMLQLRGAISKMRPHSERFERLSTTGCDTADCSPQPSGKLSLLFQRQKQAIMSSPLTRRFA